MDPKSILNARKKLNELASQHNKLTTLVACLLNEINMVKRELSELKGGDNSSQQQQSPQYQQVNLQQNQQFQQLPPQYQQQQQRVSSQNQQKQSNNKFANFSDLRAEEILQQLSINNTSSTASIDN
jgi:hypothetical protein